MQKDEYISRFSHELRNPLTLISSSLQLLEKECPAVRESTLWEQIRKDMADVIELLREMSAPFGKLQTSSVNAAEFLSELCASFAPSMELRGIRFAAELPDTLSGIILNADRQKLRQALTNLLLNAADAVCESFAAGTLQPMPLASSSPEAAASAAISSKDGHSAFGTVTLSAAIDGADLCIHVRDNGPGIPEEYLADLFEPFVTHKKNGTGQGLSVAKAVAERHGGSLFVDTKHSCSSSGGSLDASASYTDFCLAIPLRHTADCPAGKDFAGKESAKK